MSKLKCIKRKIKKKEEECCLEPHFVSLCDLFVTISYLYFLLIKVCDPFYYLFIKICNLYYMVIHIPIWFYFFILLSFLNVFIHIFFVSAFLCKLLHCYRDFSTEVNDDTLFRSFRSNWDSALCPFFFFFVTWYSYIAWLASGFCVMYNNWVISFIVLVNLCVSIFLHMSFCFCVRPKCLVSLSIVLA